MEALQVEIWNMESEPSEPPPCEVVVSEEECIVSFTASRDGSKLLLNMANRSLHLWDMPQARSPHLWDTPQATLVQKFKGASERHSRLPPPPPSFAKGETIRRLDKLQWTGGYW